MKSHIFKTLFKSLRKSAFLIAIGATQTYRIAVQQSVKQTRTTTLQFNSIYFCFNLQMWHQENRYSILQITIYTFLFTIYILKSSQQFSHAQRYIYLKEKSPTRGLQSSSSYLMLLLVSFLKIFNVFVVALRT